MLDESLEKKLEDKIKASSSSPWENTPQIVNKGDSWSNKGSTVPGTRGVGVKRVSYTPEKRAKRRKTQAFEPEILGLTQTVGATQANQGTMQIIQATNSDQEKQAETTQASQSRFNEAFQASQASQTGFIEGDNQRDHEGGGVTYDQETPNEFRLEEREQMVDHDDEYEYYYEEIHEDDDEMEFPKQKGEGPEESNTSSTRPPSEVNVFKEMLDLVSRGLGVNLIKRL